MSPVLAVASYAVAEAAAQLDATEKSSALRAWFIAKGGPVIAAVDAFAEGTVPHNDVWERLARGHIDSEISDEAKNLIATLPGLFDKFWKSAQRGFR